LGKKEAKKLNIGKMELRFQILTTYTSADKAKSMRNRPDGAAPENAELAFSGDFAATGRSDFELFRYNCT